MPLLPLLFNIMPESASQSKQAEEIKDIQIEKEELKLPLFTDYMILYIEGLKDSTKKNWVNKFSKNAKYKINVQRTFILLYNNELPEKLRK